VGGAARRGRMMERPPRNGFAKASRSL